METRTYSELYALIEALCGVSFATVEQPRIKALVNRRATKAYRATNYWPRFLVVGEERAATAGLIPYEEEGLAAIDSFLRIHLAAPFASASATEFHFHVGASGATLVCGDLDLSTAFVTYKSRHTATYGDGTSDTTAVPKEWFDYLAHGTYADFLRSEGQQEKAVLADSEALDSLTDELLRVDEQHTSGLISQRVFTHSNMQAR